MKKQILSIGEALNRSEQLAIKGGDCTYDNREDCKNECSVRCDIGLDDGHPMKVIWTCNDTRTAIL